MVDVEENETARLAMNLEAFASEDVGGTPDRPVKSSELCGRAAIVNMISRLSVNAMSTFMAEL